jgi:hypothetical protein
MHTCIQSIKKCWDTFNADHVIVTLDGRSWRKDIYSKYKENRKTLALSRTQQEVDDDRIYFDAMDKFIDFLRNKTNVTVIRHDLAEADDLIARFINLHPEDTHIVISTDKDFYQLIALNVKIYNGISGMLYQHDIILDKDGKQAKDKYGKLLDPPDPKWLLFEKCMRGDVGDNVPSAAPGARTKKLIAAFQDKDTKGYAWNNLLLSRWVDQEGIDHRVRDDYERNKLLIDLTMQPSDLIEKFDNQIINSVNTPRKTQIGIALMRFCNTYGLVKLEKQTAEYSSCFSSPYHGPLIISQVE